MKKLILAAVLAISGCATGPAYYGAGYPQPPPKPEPITQWQRYPDDTHLTFNKERLECYGEAKQAFGYQDTLTQAVLIKKYTVACLQERGWVITGYSWR